MIRTGGRLVFSFCWTLLLFFVSLVFRGFYWTLSIAVYSKAFVYQCFCGFFVECVDKKHSLIYYEDYDF